MPVRKFRSIEEMKGPRQFAPGDPGIWQVAERRWQIHRFLTSGVQATFVPGVRKFRSILEKRLATEQRSTTTTTSIEDMRGKDPE